MQSLGFFAFVFGAEEGRATCAAGLGLLTETFVITGRWRDLTTNELYCDPASGRGDQIAGGHALHSASQMKRCDLNLTGMQPTCGWLSAVAGWWIPLDSKWWKVCGFRIFQRFRRSFTSTHTIPLSANGLRVGCRHLMMMKLGGLDHQQTARATTGETETTADANVDGTLVADTWSVPSSPAVPWALSSVWTSARRESPKKSTEAQFKFHEKNLRNVPVALPPGSSVKMTCEPTADHNRQFQSEGNGTTRADNSN